MAAKQVVVRSSGGIGILGALGILFLTLKLLGVSAVASWPWVWVLAPFWIPFALILLFGFIWMIVISAVALVGYHKDKKARDAKLNNRRK